VYRRKRENLSWARTETIAYSIVDVIIVIYAIVGKSRIREKTTTPDGITLYGNDDDQTSDR